MTPRRAARIRAGIIAAREPQPWTHYRATWDAYMRTIRRTNRPQKEDQ